MKKILSILMAIAMLFTFAAIPAFAEGEAVDFTAAANIAYQKSVATIVAEGEPVAVTELTDGNEETAYTLEGAVTLDLGASYQVNDITLYFGGESASVNVYAGNAVDAANLIGTATNAASTVNANGKIAQYITIESATAIAINEIFVDTQLIDGDWNIAKGKSAFNTYPKTSDTNKGMGNYYYSSGDPANGKFTDADVSTSMSANANDSRNKQTDRNTVWTLDLGGYYLIDEITIYASNTKTDSKNNVSFYLGQTKEINGWSTITSDTRKFTTSLFVPDEAIYVTSSSNLTGTLIDVGTVDISDKKEVARYITVVYSCYQGGVADISVKGTPLAAENVVDFRAKDNLAAGKSEYLAFSRPNDKGTAGNFYSSNYPKNGVNKMTDGNISTAYSGHKAHVIRIDLGDIYDITSVDLYCTKDTQGSTNYNIYLDTTATYDLGSVSADRKKRDAHIGDGFITVNGVDRVRKGTMNFDSVPARYVYFEYNGTSSFYTSQIVVNGTKTVKFGEAGNCYSYNVDEETGAKTVTSVLRLFNGTGTASQTGKVYFAAYNASDALIGYTVADAASLEAGASVEIAPAAFAVTEEPAYVKAFYWVDGTFVPVLLPTAIK